MRKKILALTVLLTSAFILLFSVNPALTAETVVFGGGPPASEWYSIAAAIGNLWKNNIPDLSVKHIPGGGVANAMSVNSGKATVGISVSASNYNALHGKPPFKQELKNLRGLVSLYMTYCALAVWKDSGIRELTDLKGKTLAPGIKGFSYEAMIHRELQAVGLDYSDMKTVEFVPANTAADLMKDGHVDAAGKTANKFNSWLLNLGAQREIYLVESPDDVLKQLMAENEGIYRAVVNKGDYNGIDKDIQVPGYRLCLIVNKDTPEDLVYRLVKTLAENWIKEMHPVTKTFASVPPEELALPVGLEFHPGAMKYFKEKGWAK